MGQRVSQARQAGSTRFTGVCWSMNSLTMIAQGVASGVRQGRSRLLVSYQSMTVECSSGSGSGSKGASVAVMAVMALRSSHGGGRNRTGALHSDSVEMRGTSRFGSSLGRIKLRIM